MNVNGLLNDITRGAWLLDFTAYQEYFQLYQQYISGKRIFEKKAPVIPQLCTDMGLKEYSPGHSSLKSEKKAVGLVTMTGMILKYSGMCTLGADEIINQLDILNSDTEVESIILRMDGPGGSVAAISPFLDFALRKKKPVVGLFDSMFSLYYWAGVGVCDYLMAENTISARAGSVGVVLSLSDYSEKRKKEGITDHEIYPPESEHKNLPLTLALKGQYDMIKKEMLSPVAIEFQNTVRSNRPNLIEETGVLTGKTFGAKEALRLGMIDGIGNLEKAVEMARMLSEINQF